MRQRRLLPSLAGVLLFAAALSAVGPAKADPVLAQAKQLKDPQGAYTIEVPDDWQVTTKQGCITANDPGNGPRLMVLASPRTAESLQKCAEGLIPIWKRNYPSWTETSRKTVQVCGLEALYLRATVTDEGATVFEEHCMVLTPQHELLLLIRCPQVSFERYRGTMRDIIASWRIAGGAPQPQPQPQPQPRPSPAPQPQPTAGGTKRIKDFSGVASIAVPADWTVDAQEFGTSAYPPGRRATAQLVATPKPSVSLHQFAQEMMTRNRQSTPNWTQTAMETTAAGGRPAVRIRDEAPFGGVPMVFEYLFTESDQHFAMLTLFCPKRDHAQFADTFARIAASVRLIAAQPQPVLGPAPQPNVAGRPPSSSVPSSVAPPLELKQVSDPGGAFSIAVPRDWQARQQPGSATASDPTGRAVAMAVATPRQAQRLQEFCRATTDVWRQNAPGWRHVAIQDYQVSGKPAVYIRATGTPGGQAMVADYILVLTDRFQVWFMVSCRQQESPQWEATFRHIILSFEVR